MARAEGAKIKRIEDKRHRTSRKKTVGGPVFGLLLSAGWCGALEDWVHVRKRGWEKRIVERDTRNRENRVP